MIKVSQYFNGHGLWGVVLFVLGNIAAAWLAVAIAAAPDHAPSGLLAYLIMAGSGFAVLISVPLMLVGREYDMRITEIPKELRRAGDAQ